MSIKIASAEFSVASDPTMAYERLGDRFEEAISHYDTRRRVETLIDEFLVDLNLGGMHVLEVGTGLGYFARRLCQRGALVTATDIAPSLVARVRASLPCVAEVVDALQLSDHFADRQFDLVLSSECIEHTAEPMQAVVEMIRVLRPGGYLVLSTPNRLWQPVVRLASTLKLRPFDGLENFSTFRGLTELLSSQDMRLLKAAGLHLFPFQLGAHGLSTWCDRHLQAFRRFMINICLFAQKPHVSGTSNQ